MANAKTASFSWDAVFARRLERHGLAEPVPTGQLAQQVGLICGAHAQVISAAEISIGLRVAGSTRQQIQDALWTDHSLIKTFGPRGTVHLLYSEDLPMWTGALSAMPPIRSMEAKGRVLTLEQLEAVIAAIDEALQDAELTVDELTEAIVAIAGSWAGDRVMDAFQDKWPRWRDATNHAANRGVLCFGTNKGRKVTYTNPRRWLPKFEPADGQTALADLVKRYLYAYGPATPAQFARWMSTPVTWATALFDSLSGEIEAVDVDSTTAWIVAGDTKMPAKAPEGVRLLPYFDVYVVGCHPREKVFPGKAAQRALARTQAGNFPVLLIDGKAAGVWHQRRSGKKIEITVEPLEKLTAAQSRGLDEQVEWLGAFLDGTPHLTIGEVKVGAHA
jgi:hypothetical protein